MAIGISYANRIAKRKGVVTSVHVFEAMRQAGIDLSGHDHVGWVRCSARQISNASALRVGSHGRPVSVWAPAGGGMSYEHQERVAICVESGVSQKRAEEIAKCETSEVASAHAVYTRHAEQRD